MSFTSLWWQLPGPAQFVTRVVDALRAGRNVVLSLPQHLPGGLAMAVRAALADDAPVWTTLRADEDSNVPPALRLCRRFLPALTATDFRNAQTLSAAPAFEGQLIWLDGVTETAWPPWRAFLTEYQHACRATYLLRRTLFCVALPGALAPPEEDVCLTRMQWRGVVGRLDMLWYAATLLREQSGRDGTAPITVALVARLAAFDPALAERLAATSIDDLLVPQPLLRALAEERGWDTAGAPCWAAGQLDEVDGQRCAHLAALAAAPQAEEISRRIWSAQVGVIFPLLEEQRRRLIEAWWDWLRVPFVTPYGTVTDRRDLELGHLEAQLMQSPLRAHPRLPRLLQRLKELRNDLAHLRPLSAAQLRYQEMRELHTGPPDDA